MKKTITTLTLAATMFFGATFANAGIIITDRATTASADDNGTNRDGIIVFGRDGIIVFGFGIIVF